MVSSRLAFRNAPKWDKSVALFLNRLDSHHGRPQEKTDLKRWAMDTLVCSANDCRNELDLKVFQAHQIELETEQIEEIDEALLTCPKCGRWYPVIDGIACLLTDNLRMTGKQHIEETRFLERWKDEIGSSILKEGKPFGLVT